MEVLKELPERLSETMKVSRRGFLKGLGALSATAAIYGCGGGENLAQYKTEPSVTPQDSLVLDKELKVVMASHPFNCGGRCELKIHVKNGRMVKITGFGDTPRADGDGKGEDTTVYQTRACLRGYAQIKRTYAPDRLKYPLKQTMERGNYRGFKRISWDEALDTVAKWIGEMQSRQKELGYLPIIVSSGNSIREGSEFNTGSNVLKYLGFHLVLSGVPSSENINYAKYATIGLNAASNSKIDMLNTKFLLNWAQDPTIKAVNDTFMLTKAKEAGIPIVTVSSTLTDSVSPLSTGYSKYNLPAWIQPRPQTDTAMLSAMANVIYRKNLHDDAFIKQYCFGFYPGDSVVSQSTMTNPLTNSAYTGQTFVCPPGMSFVEYLNGLEAKYGGYNGVLKWASDLSGVPADVIERLGIAYGETKPAMMWAGNAGGQKANNGMQHCMFTICLAAMTGNTIKRGGGPGFDLGGGPGAVTLGQPNTPITTAVAYLPINMGGSRFYDVVANGRDQRTAEQLRADVLKSQKIDLGADARIKVQMLYGGHRWGNSLNSAPNTAKNVMAMKHSNLKYYVIHEQFITPTAAFADIILPAATHHERPGFFSGYYDYCHNTVIDPMYECKTDLEIDTLLAKKLGVDYGLKGGRTEKDEMRERWDKAVVSATYKGLYPDAKLPTFDEFVAKGVAEFPLTPDKSILGLASTAAGKYQTETGRIQFISMYYFNRDKDLGDKYKKPDGGYYRTQYPPKAMYARPYEGYQDILEGKVGAKGIKYTLLFTTNHPRNRAHTVYDNVPMLKDHFPAVVRMHPIDAAARGISSGDEVYVFNDWGCMKMPALVTKRWRPGIVDIQDGNWYRASTTETYEAWLDTNLDGIPEKQVVPVDVGGCPNSITHDFDDGPIDPIPTARLSNNHFNGNLVEVSKTHPDKK